MTAPTEIQSIVSNYFDFNCYSESLDAFKKELKIKETAFDFHSITLLKQRKGFKYFYKNF